MLVLVTNLFSQISLTPQMTFVVGYKCFLIPVLKLHLWWDLKTSPKIRDADSEKGDPMYRWGYSPLEIIGQLRRLQCSNN